MTLNQRIIWRALTIALLLAMPSHGAAQEQSAGERAALHDIGRAWRDKGLGTALRMSETAAVAFPQSDEIKLACGVLLEVAGRTDEALRLYIRLSASRGTRDVPEGVGMNLTMRELCDAACYRLYTRSGDMERALVHYRAFWKSASTKRQDGMDTNDIVVLRAWIDIEEASLLADGAHDVAAATQKLATVERSLRDTCRGATLEEPTLASLAYRQCLYEWNRLVAQASPSSAPVTGPPEGVSLGALPLDQLMASGPSFVGLLSAVFMPPLALPSHLDGVLQSSLAATSQSSKSRLLRAVSGYLAGVCAIQNGRTADAIPCFASAADADTCLQPLAAASLARVAVQLADQSLRQASRPETLATGALERLRAELADGLRDGKVTALPSR